MQDNSLHVVIYLEVGDRHAAEGAALLASHVANLRGSGNAHHASAYTERGQANRLIVSERWKSGEAHSAYRDLATGSPFSALALSIELAPADIRLHHAWNTGDDAAIPSGAIHVFTHIDVPPPHLQGLEVIFRPFVDASRNDNGNLRFDAVQSTSRPNHFTLIESWATEEQRRAHVAAPHTRAFRTGLNPMLGALYDQRIYARID